MGPEFPKLRGQILPTRKRQRVTLISHIVNSHFHICLLPLPINAEVSSSYCWVGTNGCLHPPRYKWSVSLVHYVQVSLGYHASLNHPRFVILIEQRATMPKWRSWRSEIVAPNIAIDPVRLSRLIYPKAAAKTRQRVPNRRITSLDGLAYTLLYHSIKVSAGRACMALAR